MDRTYANVFTRFAAIVIDGLLVLPFYVPLAIAIRFEDISDPMHDWSIAMSLLFAICIIGAIVFAIWNTIVRMGNTGQSLGRKFLNIAVLDRNGRPIGIGRAALREIIGRWVSGIVCYIGYLNAFWDSKSQMWHDKMADCYVFNVEENFRQTSI